MQTCSYCLREISEYIPFCFYCNKSATLHFLKLPDPDLSYFLTQVKESKNLEELNLFDYLNPKTIRLDLKEDGEIHSTEETINPDQEEKANQEEKEENTKIDIEENISVQQKEEKFSEFQQENLETEKISLEEAYFSVDLEEKPEENKKPEEFRILDKKDEPEKSDFIEETQNKKILFGADLEESQYLSLSQELSRDQKVSVEKESTGSKESLDQVEELKDIPENCSYLLFDQQEEPQIPGTSQDENLQYVIFSDTNNSVNHNQKNKSSFFFWIILLIGIVLGIFIGRLL